MSTLFRFCVVQYAASIMQVNRFIFLVSEAAVFFSSLSYAQCIIMS